MADHPIIDAHVHTYRSREVGRQAMMGSDRTDYGGTPEELLALMEDSPALGIGLSQHLAVQVRELQDRLQGSP